MLLLKIFGSSTAPIFVLIGLGILVDRIFNLHIPTLSKLNFYVFSPAILFSVVYDSQLQGEQVLQILIYIGAQAGTMFLLGLVLSAIKPLSPYRTHLTMGAVFTNAAVYGIPVMLLAFGQYAVEIQTIIMVTQSLLTYTVGVVAMNSHQASIRSSLSQFMRFPVIYALILALLMRFLHLPVIDPVRIPLDKITGGFVAVALMTLGAELSRSQISGNATVVSIIGILRLLLAPTVSAGLLLFVFHFEHAVEEVLFVAAGLPVAINVYVLAAEFNREPALASRMVFWTTIVSGITIPLLLLLAPML